MAVTVMVVSFTVFAKTSATVVADTTEYPVHVAQAKQTDFPEYLQALGSMSAVKAVTISALVDGAISKIFYSNGQSVTKDTVVVQQDTQQAQAKVDKAQASYLSQQQKYERYKQLQTEQIADISQQEIDDQKANLATAKAELSEQEAALDDLSIKAPFSGTLGEFTVKAGDYVTAGTMLVKLVNSTQLLANYNIPQNDKPQLKIGQTVRVSVKAYPDKVFYGTVNFISPTVNDATRTLTIQALVGNPDGLLSSGMFVQVKQQIAVQKGVTVVPDQAVLADVKGYYVFKVVGNKASQVYVKLGTRQDGQAQITDGLQAGDTVVTLGQQKLQDGSVITVLPDETKDDNSTHGASTATKQ